MCFSYPGQGIHILNRLLFGLREGQARSVSLLLCLMSPHEDACPEEVLKQRVNQMRAGKGECLAVRSKEQG